jgi:hypothetical protein
MVLLLCQTEQASTSAAFATVLTEGKSFPPTIDL